MYSNSEMFLLTNQVHSYTCIACENIRFSSLFVYGDETSPAAKSEEKRMFSQANVCTRNSNTLLPVLYDQILDPLVSDFGVPKILQLPVTKSQ